MGMVDIGQELFGAIGGGQKNDQDNQTMVFLGWRSNQFGGVWLC